MKRSGTLTTLVTGLLIIVLLMGMEITKAQSFFRQTGIQLLTKQEGLSNNTLTEIHQDKDGFLWLGTDVGLSRYDGIHFHNYNSADKEPYSITGIYETSDKNALVTDSEHEQVIVFQQNERMLHVTFIVHPGSADRHFWTYV